MKFLVDEEKNMHYIRMLDLILTYSISSAFSWLLLEEKVQTILTFSKLFYDKPSATFLHQQVKYQIELTLRYTFNFHAIRLTLYKSSL